MDMRVLSGTRIRPGGSRMPLAIVTLPWSMDRRIGDGSDALASEDATSWWPSPRAASGGPSSSLGVPSTLALRLSRNSWEKEGMVAPGAGVQESSRAVMALKRIQYPNSTSAPTQIIRLMKREQKVHVNKSTRGVLTSNESWTRDLHPVSGQNAQRLNSCRQIFVLF